MAKPFRIEGKSGWWIRVTDEFGKRRKKCFEAHEEAAKALALERARVIEVRRGQRDPTPPTKRYDDVADYWAEFKVPQKRSGTDDLSIMRAHLRPFFGGMKLADIGVETVDRYLAEKKDLSKKTVNNHLTLLITQLNLAHELHWIHRAPRIKKPRIRLFDADYDYLRTSDEIRRFLDAAEREGQLVHACDSTATFTGAREGEIAALTWDDINFETRLITIQRSFDGPTKAGDVRYVPILDVLLPVLRRWRLRCPGKLVFPNANGGMQCESARIFQEVLHRVLDAAGFPRFPRPNGKFRYYVTFHDLRHTFASLWVMNGGDIFKLQKILGHKSIAMTMRYSHLSPAMYAGDLSRFGPALRMDGDLLHLPVQEETAPLQELAPDLAAPTS